MKKLANQEITLSKGEKARIGEFNKLRSFFDTQAFYVYCAIHEYKIGIRNSDWFKNEVFTVAKDIADSEYAHCNKEQYLEEVKTMLDETFKGEPTNWQEVSKLTFRGSNSIFVNVFGEYVYEEILLNLDVDWK